MIIQASLLLFGVLVWGLDVFNYEPSCGLLLDRDDCQLVPGCWWNSTATETPDPNGGYPISTTGRCVLDPCLKVVPTGTSCGNYPWYLSTEPNCMSSPIRTLTEHWCTDSSLTADCLDTTGLTCYNYTTLSVETELVCAVLNSGPLTSGADFCTRYAFVNSGSCPSSPQTATLFEETRLLNCKEYDVGGVKVCAERSGCEAHGAANCSYFPSCMIVGGQCVADECYANSLYDRISGQCNGSPDVCTGHSFKVAQYNYTYQYDRTTFPEFPWKYISYKRAYTDTWACTNKQFNHNPNPYSRLRTYAGAGFDYPNEEDNMGVGAILHYEFDTRCDGNRDNCKFCSKFKVDTSECTGAGGVVKNVDGEDICVAETETSAAFTLRLPSAALLSVLVAMLLLVFN